MANSDNESEVGRELKADELEAGKIVFTTSERWQAKNMYFSYWVELVTTRMVVLLSALPGKEEVRIGLYCQPDGTLKDGQQKVVRVYEYLGDYPKSDEVHARN